MVGIFEIILLLCLLACFTYIFWLHHHIPLLSQNYLTNGANKNNKQKKYISQKEKSNEELLLDNISLSGINDNASMNDDNLFDGESSELNIKL